MTVHLIPDRLTVPLTWAASFIVDSKVTARDQSYSLTVGWLAAQRDSAMDGQDVFIGDNGLRLALQRSRRGTKVEENNRVKRTIVAKATVDGVDDLVSLPSLQIHYTSAGGVRVHRGGIVRDGDRQLQWTVPADLAAAMRVVDGEPSVELPWSIMQHARSRLTITLMLRVLAMIAGDHGASWLVKHDGQRIVLSIPYSEVLVTLGLPAKSEPRETMRKLLLPAAVEISERTDYVVKISEQRVRYRAGPNKGKEGPLTGLMLEIEYPVIETPLSYPAPRKRGAPWKPKPKYAKPPKPADAPPAFVEKIREFPEDYEDDDFDDEPIVHIDTSNMIIPGRRFGSQRKQGE